MKFLVNVRGDFTNIKGLVISQRYFINVECGTCGTVHKKSVFISDEMRKEVKVKEVKGMVVNYNVTVECRNCRGVMGITISEPQDKIIIDEETGFYVHPVINDDLCHISTIHSDTAVVKDVDGLILDVVSQQNEIFRNCDFDHHILAEERKGRTVDIQRFNIEVVEAH